MPATRQRTIWPTRIAWPGAPDALAPALALAQGVSNTAARTRSRFTLSPLALSLDQLLLIITATLLGIGVVMVHSAEARVGPMPHDWLLRSLLTRSTVHAVLALGAMLLLWNIDYRRLAGETLRQSVTLLALLATIFMLVLVLTRFGADINGSRRWLLLPLGFARVSFQPSELAKWSLVLFIAAYAVHAGPNIRSFLKGFVPLIAALGITAALIVREDFGTAALICGVCFVLLLMSGCRWWHIALLIPPTLVVTYFAVWHSAYRRERLLIFMHPQMDPTGAGYHPIQSLLSFASGGFWGRGLGNGIQKMGFLPEDNTDFIFSVIAEELGFFGCLMVIALFLGLTVTGWQIARRAKDKFGKMVACGVTAMVGLQAAMNIAVVTVTVPTKGIALPLISSGGTGWIMTAAAIGILMSIERVNRLGLPSPVALPVEAPAPEKRRARKRKRGQTVNEAITDGAAAPDATNLAVLEPIAGADALLLSAASETAPDLAAAGENALPVAEAAPSLFAGYTPASAPALASASVQASANAEFPLDGAAVDPSGMPDSATSESPTAESAMGAPQPELPFALTDAAPADTFNITNNATDAAATDGTTKEEPPMGRTNSPEDTGAAQLGIKEEFV